jgi:hypothetical protein
MQLLLSHWHCVLPIIAIAAAAFFMRDKPKTKRKNERGETDIK